MLSPSSTVEEVPRCQGCFPDVERGGVYRDDTRRAELTASWEHAMRARNCIRHALFGLLIVRLAGVERGSCRWARGLIGGRECKHPGRDDRRQ